MFLLFCAQIIGAPIEVPTAAPASAPAPLRTLRRPHSLPWPFILRAISTSPLLVSSALQDVHVLGHPRQDHRLAGRYWIGVEARLRHHRRQGLQACDVD